jgi:hypothetical protein
VSRIGIDKTPIRGRLTGGLPTLKVHRKDDAGVKYINILRSGEGAMKHLFVTAVLLAVCSGHTVFASGGLPEFKIKSCRQAEESGSASRDAQACFRDEQTAKDTLRENWKTYDSDQKNHCQQLMKAGGMPSYVELLTCVEMKPAPTTPTGKTTKKRGM